MGYDSTYITYIAKQIVENVCDYGVKDEDDYEEQIIEEINSWIAGCTGEIKELVNHYGIFKAIKDYREEMGEFIPADYESGNYELLGFVILKKMIDEEYKYEDCHTEDEDEDE